jgi:hypothetical protein
MVKKLYDWKPKSIKLVGRQKIRWENHKKEELRAVKTNNGTRHTQDRVKLTEVSEKSKTFKQ